MLEDNSTKYMNMKKSKSYVDFKSIKQSVSMEQILTHYGLLDKLARKGDSLSGINPFDTSSTNPTRFRVSLSKNCWNVFGSELGGNVLDFVAQMENIGVRSAAIKMQEWFGLTTSTPDLPVKPVSQEKQRQTTSPLKEREQGRGENTPLGFSLKHLDSNHTYLTERALDRETIEHFGLGFCNKGILKGRIAIPIHNVNGDLVAYIGRWPGSPPEGEGKYKLPKGFHKSLEIFNLHRAIQHASMPLIIVEGVFDCMRIWQLGYPAVGAILGSDLSDNQTSLLQSHWGGNILLLFDADEAGKSGCSKALVRLGVSHWVRTASLPNPETQPDDLVLNAFKELLTTNGIEFP
jgi:DNA primase